MDGFEIMEGYTQSTSSSTMSVFRNILGAALQTAANRPGVEKFDVFEISGNQNIANVSYYPVNLRAECLVLHGPCNSSGLVSLTKTWRYNVILHVPLETKMFSLFRTDDIKEAENIFIVYKETFPLLVPIDKTICEKTRLDKMCAKLRENKGWSGVHIAAAFDLVKCLKDPKLVRQLDAQEGENNLTPLHIAVMHDNKSSVKALIDAGAQMDLRDLKGNSVFHYAAKQSTDVLQLLLDKLPERYHFLIDDLNGEGFTPLHMACFNNKAENVKALLCAGANVNISSSKDGCTPIHAAVKSHSLCCIQELVSKNRHQLAFRDLQQGGTPLHWANGPDVLKSLLELGCDPNLPNNMGETPLHNAVRQNCLKSTLALLCHNTFPDFRGQDGNTALHLAAQMCSKLIIQCLVVFGANLNITNDHGHTPRHIVATSLETNKDEVLFILHAVGAQRCPETKASQCTPGCKFSENYDGIAPTNYQHSSHKNLLHEAMQAVLLKNNVEERRGSIDHVEESMDFTVTSGNSFVSENANGFMPKNTSSDIKAFKYNQKRLLSLDGGGIRGLVITQMLLVIEQELGIPIVDAFDYIAGTSTGGILALALACGKSVLEVQAIYLKLKDKVFTGQRPYSAEVMEEFLKNEFGMEKTMCSIEKPKLMIMSALVDRRPADLHIFRNYESPASLLGVQEPCEHDPSGQLVWETAKVTGAAPTYFRLDHNMFIDGGLIANNPTLDAMSELQQLNAAQRALTNGSNDIPKFVSCVVTLGTGIQPKESADASNLDIAWPSNFVDALMKVPRLGSLVNLLIDQATQSEGQVVERSRAWCSSIGAPFFRFSPSLTSFVDLDETNDEKLVHMMWTTRAYMVEHKKDIQDMKSALLKQV